MASSDHQSRTINCCGHKQTLNRQKVCLCGCGSCCLLGAILVAIFWTSIFLSILSSQLALSPNSITFNMWKETPLPMYMNVVLFNWTNPNSSLNGPEKPAFTEMGPYIFSEVHTKQRIEWNEDNSTITFLNRNEWHFLPELSNGSLSDVITNLNPVAMRNMSDTADGVITMYTGGKDIESLGLLTSWNYQTSTGCYPGECGRVHATIGNVLPLSTFKQNQFTLFNTDICGVYSLEYEKLVELHQLPGVQYQATDSMFSNSETCYCPSQTCPAKGVRDITSCRKAPLFVSLPHFLHADSSYLEAILGLQPNESKHAFFMSLANLTSVPLVVRVRLQTNLLMESVPNMTFFRNLSTTYMPMYWVDQYATLTPDLASLMHPLYTLSAWGGWIILGIFGGLGTILLLLGFILRCKNGHHN